MTHDVAASVDEDEAEQLSSRHPGNVKIVYPPAPNGSHKIVWAWACGTTGILVAIIGGVALYFAGQQSETNQRVADALMNLAVKVGQLETKIDNMERQQ